MGIQQNVSSAGTSAVREASPWIRGLARLGYAAKALLYGTIGILALQLARGTGGRTTDSLGALHTVLNATLGWVLLALMAAGLAGYGVWRVIAAALDPEGHGTGGKGILIRTGYLLRGLAHLALALTAAKLAKGTAEARGTGSETEISGRVLQLPAGAWLLGGAGLLVVGYGLYQIYKGGVARLSRHLDLSELGSTSRRWAMAIARFGLAARGIVFCLIGGFLVQAAIHHNAQRAGGVEQSLDTLRGVGRWPLLVVAAGLVAYGVYELLNARFRRIRVG